MHYYPDYGFGLGAFGLLAGLFHFLLWVFIIVLVIRFFRRRGHMNWHNHMWGDRGALGILRERYAKGEISKEEYEERKKVLEAK